ncbi:MAG: hypothetical protein SNH73_04175 [Rikenellaceae bacterium]
MVHDNCTETMDLLINNDVLRLSEIPDNLLDAWIAGVVIKADYDYSRDFIINIFNEIYEVHKEQE